MGTCSHRIRFYICKSPIGTWVMYCLPFYSRNIYDFMLESNALFYALNPSNHNVIPLSVTNLKNKTFARSNEMETKHIPKCAWNKATDKHLDDYRTMLNNRITDIKDNCDLFLCTDITCENR